MPRLLLLLLSGTLTLLCSCWSGRNGDPFTEKIDKQKARQDFTLFKKIIEEAHPALTEYLRNDRRDFLFDSVYNTVDKDISLRSLFNKISFITNEIGCSHTYVSYPSLVTDTLQNRALFFPIPVILVNDAVYANSDHVVPRGSKILAVNGVLSGKLLDSLAIYHPIEGTHRETQRYIAATDFSIDYFSHFGAKKEFEVLIKDTLGDIKTLFLPPITLDEWNTRNRSLSYFDATDVSYSLDINDEASFATIRLPSFELETTNQQSAFEGFLKNSFDLLSKKKDITNLIIDLRENTGGDLYNCFLFFSYLAKKDFLEYSSVVSRISKVPYDEYLSVPFYEKAKHLNKKLDTAFVKSGNSDYRMAPATIDKWEPNALAFKGNVFLITNSRVMSAASYFTLLCKHEGAKVVGVETTGGEYSGNGFTALEYTLPNSGLRFGFPYVQINYTYAQKKTGRGIIPDYIVPDTYNAFTNNSDRQLIFITDSLLQKNK